MKFKWVMILLLLLGIKEPKNGKWFRAILILLTK